MKKIFALLIATLFVPSVLANSNCMVGSQMWCIRASDNTTFKVVSANDKIYWTMDGGNGDGVTIVENKSCQKTGNKAIRYVGANPIMNDAMLSISYQVNDACNLDFIVPMLGGKLNPANISFVENEVFIGAGWQNMETLHFYGPK